MKGKTHTIPQEEVKEAKPEITEVKKEEVKSEPVIPPTELAKVEEDNKNATAPEQKQLPPVLNEIQPKEIGKVEEPPSEVPASKQIKLEAADIQMIRKIKE